MMLYPQMPIMENKASNGIGTTLNVKDFLNIGVEVFTKNSANLKLFCKASLQDDMPDFSAAASETNRWFYIELADLGDSASPVRGIDGIVLTGTDISKGYEINTNEAKWINFHITNYAAGNIWVYAAATNNQ